MKNIKRKIFQIILTVFMVFSSCFLTGTVKAVDDTNSTRTGYFDNENIYVSDNKVVDDEGNNEREKPTQIIESESDDGSTLTEGSNEGLVWTNKKVEQIGNEGIYKITFQTIGFKYRHVDENNDKVDNRWKNPLAGDSTLAISEKVADNFHLIENDSNYPMSLTNDYEDYFKSDDNVEFSYDSSTKEVKLSFNANDVKLDKYDDENKFCYDESNDNDNGIAFDVEGSFFVQIDANVDAGITYKTGDANSTFEPATDNFYYYEWGAIPTTYKIDGLKCRNNEDHWIRIQDPNKAEGIIEFPDINGNKGSFEIPDDWYACKGTPGSYYDRDNVFREGEYKIATSRFTGEGIKSIQMYVCGAKTANYIYFRIVIIYDTNPETQIILEPKVALPSNGGNDAKSIDLYTIILKEDSTMRENKDPDGDGIIESTFNNHGEIILALPSINYVITKKTASLVDWDERTYRIDLYAASNLQQQAEPVDIMFALDFSGSMPWMLNEPEQKIVYDQLDTVDNRNRYHIKHNGTMGTISKWQSFEYFVKGDDGEYKPIGYFDEKGIHGWYALKSGGTGDKVNKGSIRYDEKLKVNEETDIFVKGGNKTKLDELLEQVQSFIDNIANSSPDSTIGFSCFAGTDMGTSNNLLKAKDLQGDGLSNFLNEKRVYLAGNTAQGVGIEKSAHLLSTSSHKNKYIILFTDGAEKNDENQISADDAAKSAKNQGIKIYTIGLANSNNIDQMKEKLESWSSNDNNNKDYYYPASDYTEFENAFKAIFSDLVGSIKNVVITDIIDERFYIPYDELTRLQSLEGVAVNGNTITWTIPELVYSENVENGSHLTIKIKAKDDFLGGNYIPTNADGSVVTVGGESDDLDKPVVNVKTLPLTMQDISETYFLGEEITPTEFVDDLLKKSNYKFTDDEINSILEQLNTNKKVTLNYSYGNTNDNVGQFEFKYEPVNNEDMDTHGLFKTSQDDNPVEEYKLKVSYNPDSVDERLESLSGYIYTDEESFKKDEHTNCTHTENPDLIGKKHIATDVSADGTYKIIVVDGWISVTKNIDKLTNQSSQGDPIFTFKLEGTTVSGKNVLEYRTVRFDGSGLTKTAKVFDNLEKGVYTITELDTYRYIQTQIQEDHIGGLAYHDISGESVTFYIGCSNIIVASSQEKLVAILKGDMDSSRLSRRDGSIKFINNLIIDDEISDTDVVTNSFEVDGNGKVTINQEYYKVKESN